MILVWEGSFAVYHQYEACVPSNCGNGPNISFPFYVPGLQESYCGYPGFQLNCSKDGHPLLSLPENDYVVEAIFYANSSFRVYDAAAPSPLSADSSCPRIRNTTLPTDGFVYAGNLTGLHLLSNCPDNLPGTLEDVKVLCDNKEDKNNWILAIYDEDLRLKDALGNCARNVIAPVEAHGDNQSGTLAEVLGRGFMLNWTASDYSLQIM
ncbi:LEAF RUST 10 DISEASE-RESISTANCE LOCUS RECEPTOR-LIKE PROTEIN KINASE-like 1.2 [Sesamum alatum]|uniref:LEAF RUST 10 DISEASE-RESISTANCE LOCUS RECEPTOR-LIKE PROTEIN KINASE-like 1.2 n=1 Tax=Sesamum alatum TaxID=300844 RepID=A0AAE2CIN0_9LAMI|nr:LEAF RUST 10 DISEASE-RESISTANCE LOCUS RECEPTOR-LIKE PROTEIN KINASE-like 1.2 [Sesamum alatum]